MKREIKFRGLKNNTWRYGYYNYESKSNISEIIYNNAGISVDNYSIGQFTGLTDKNGKEIYEGDIVKVGGLIEIVKYIDGILCSYNERIYGKHEKVDIDVFENLIVASSDYFEPYEIIGNIHENPELIKQQ